jgi:hypothetical protein
LTVKAKPAVENSLAVNSRKFIAIYLLPDARSLTAMSKPSSNRPVFSVTFQLAGVLKLNTIFFARVIRILYGIT